MTATDVTRIEPFTIDVPQARLDDLSRRLASTRWPEPLPGAPWSRGVPRPYLEDLVEYWRTAYDWRAQEGLLNSLGSAVATIEGQRIAFLHVRSPEPSALPLLLVHGWPGSVVEFLDLAGPLADPRGHGGDPGDAFDVVIPSIPGFGFSGPIRETGWTVDRIAAAFATLMRALGYERYVAHGGDWGAAIVRDLGLTGWPATVSAVHLTAVFSPEPAAVEAGEAKARARRRREFSGYRYLQASRPATLAYGLTDSPAGQLAWIVEKMKEWSGAADLPEEAIARDAMLTNVMLYWLTGTAGSAAHLYYETAHEPRPRRPRRSEAPTAVTVFPDDVTIPVRELAEQSENIVSWSTAERGGHFPGLEVPESLIAVLRDSFRPYRAA
jgi:pimeloyl-ACP methyl ester carboxylesterase